MLSLIAKSKQFISAGESLERKINPKRLARLAAEEMSKTGISTKAQQALQLEYELQKKEKIAASRERKEVLEARKWEL